MSVLYKPFAVIGLVIFLTGCASAMPTDIAGSGDIEVIAAETPALTRNSNTKQVFGSYETSFNPKQTDRNHNIARACDAIDNKVIQPGETFSYNETVGPTSKKNGYKKGTIFINGEKSKGYGGGVCQVSSTLYNAAANAGMTIVERHDHSRPVDYVEQGNDAATSYGGVDLKFQNDKPFPVVIKTQVSDQTVSITINAV